nr:hypothetical protein [Tanacetum cinerariifolium]
MAGLLFRMFRVDRIKARGTMLGEQLQLEIGELKIALALLILIKQSRLSFITTMESGTQQDNAHTQSRQTNTFDDDVDEEPVQDLALNEDNVDKLTRLMMMWMRNQYKIWHSMRTTSFKLINDEAPTAQTMFMANLSSVDPIYDDAGPSYDSNILSEVQDYDNYLDSVGEYHEYVKDNTVQVVQSNVSSVPNDDLMMIINDMHEQAA